MEISILFWQSHAITYSDIKKTQIYQEKIISMLIVLFRRVTLCSKFLLLCQFSVHEFNCKVHGECLSRLFWTSLKGVFR